MAAISSEVSRKERELYFNVAGSARKGIFINFCCAKRSFFVRLPSINGGTTSKERDEFTFCANATDYRINYAVKVYRLCGRRTYFVATFLI